MRNIGVYMYYARPGEGKGVTVADIIRRLFRGYRKTQKRYPMLPKRMLYSNIRLSAAIEKKELRTDPVTREVINEEGHLVYWDSPRDLYDVKHADIIWDEVSRHLPADSWGDTSTKMREMFAYYRKRGNRIFMTTQDYKMVDINVRRMVKEAWFIEKLFSSRDISATLPDPTFIFGLLIKTQFNPNDIENAKTATDGKLQKKNIIPNILWISRSLVSMYDTQQEIPPFMSLVQSEVVYTCDEGEKCKEPKKGFHVRHVTI